MPVVKYKLVFLGDQNVGKTSIITRFIHDSFDGSKISTVGIDFLTKTIQLDNQTYRLQLWDTAGQQRFRSLIPGYIKDADCCIIVIDASSKESLESIPRWIDFVRENQGPQAKIYILCNKIDVPEATVNLQTYRQVATNLGMSYQEVSAKTGKQVHQVFWNIARMLHQSGVKKPIAVDSSGQPTQILRPGETMPKNGNSGCRC